MKSTIEQAFDHLRAATLSKSDVTIAVASSGAVVILVTPRVSAGPGDHLSLEEARAIGKFKTTRPIREAGRAGELAIYGTQRTRTVKRGEFEAWLESRARARKLLHVPVDEADIERRIARITREREIEKRFRELEALEKESRRGKGKKRS